jgi:hypothetical protein
MQAINDIKIVSIDLERPPVVRKEAYIDLYFKLSVKPPEDWCEDFNALGRRMDPAVKIDKKDGLCVEAWVKNIDQIVPHLEKIKQGILDCNAQYIEKAQQKQLALLAAKTSAIGSNSEQFKLNEVVAGLVF